jgi:hypothetical protein
MPAVAVTRAADATCARAGWMHRRHMYLLHRLGLRLEFELGLLPLCVALLAPPGSRACSQLLVESKSNVTPDHTGLQLYLGMPGMQGMEVMFLPVVLSAWAGSQLFTYCRAV